jgi:hypothetical protein
MRQAFLRIWKRISISQRARYQSISSATSSSVSAVRLVSKRHSTGATSGRWVDFLGHHAGGPDRLVLAMRKVDDTRPQLLAYHARFLTMPRGQGEGDSPKSFTRGHRRPQFLAVRQCPIMLSTQQPIRWLAQFAGPAHQLDHVRLTVGHVDQPGLRQLRRQFGHPFIALDPAGALFDPRAPAVGVPSARAPTSTHPVPPKARDQR